MVITSRRPLLYSVVLMISRGLSPALHATEVFEGGRT